MGEVDDGISIEFEVPDVWELRSLRVGQRRRRKGRP